MDLLPRVLRATTEHGVAAALLLSSGLFFCPAVAQDTADEEPAAETAAEGDDDELNPADLLEAGGVDYLELEGFNVDPPDKHDILFTVEPESTVICFEADTLEDDDKPVVCLIKMADFNALVWGLWDDEAVPEGGLTVIDEDPPTSDDEPFHNPPLACDKYPEGDCHEDSDNPEGIKYDTFYIDAAGYLHDPYADAVYAPIEDDEADAEDGQAAPSE